METRTLLTIVALMLAGIVTIMLVRAESDEVVSIFSSNYGYEFRIQQQP